MAIQSAIQRIFNLKTRAAAQPAVSSSDLSTKQSASFSPPPRSGSASSSRSGKSLAITIYKLSGKPTSIQVTPGDNNVWNLKIKIREAIKIPVEQQRLFLGNTILSDDEIISINSQIELTVLVRPNKVVEAIEAVSEYGWTLAVMPPVKSRKRKGE